MGRVSARLETYQGQTSYHTADNILKNSCTRCANNPGCDIREEIIQAKQNGYEVQNPAIVYTTRGVSCTEKKDTRKQI